MWKQFLWLLLYLLWGFSLPLVISARRAGELWSVASLGDTWADGKFAAANIAVFSNRGKPNHVLSVVVQVKHEVLPAPPVWAETGTQEQRETEKMTDWPAAGSELPV